MVDYSPLWETMRRKGVSQYRLIKSGVSTKIIQHMKMNVQLFPETIEQLQQILDCTEGEIVKVTPNVTDLSNPPYPQKEKHVTVLPVILSSFLVLLFQGAISYFRNKHRTED